MLNEFQSFLKKELGSTKYRDYFAEYKKMDQMRRINGDKISIGRVYEDIYAELKKSEFMILLQKQQRLKETMTIVFRICRHYIFVVATYVLASMMIIFFGKNIPVNVFCVMGMSAAFLYKTYEFVVNKYSYLDAYIIIAYKAALEKCLSEAEL